MTTKSKRSVSTKTTLNVLEREIKTYFYIKCEQDNCKGLREEIIKI